jgi:hypothetical protein
MKNRIRVSGSVLRNIICESIRDVLFEGSNMSQLYHKTSIDRLVNIIKTNQFYLQRDNHGNRGCKYYASLTRYHNNEEGYEVLSRMEDADNPIGSAVTIAFNIPKLSSVHGIDIRPFDFYGTFSKDRDGEIDNGVSSKVIHQKLNKRGSVVHDVIGYDDTNYYNMAEEEIISDTVKAIPNIINYIDNIEVFFPCPDYYDFENYYEEEEALRTFKYGYALYKLVYGTPWEDKIIMYVKDANGKVPKNGISMRDFRHWFRKQVVYSQAKHKGKRVLHKKPLGRHHIDTAYV